MIFACSNSEVGLLSNLRVRRNIGWIYRLKTCAPSAEKKEVARKYLYGGLKIAVCGVLAMAMREYPCYTNAIRDEQSI